MVDGVMINNKGAAVLQVWLLVFGFVGVVGMMGVVSGGGGGITKNPTGSKTIEVGKWTRTGNDGSLSRIATREGVPLDKLKELNPDLKGTVKGKEWWVKEGDVIKLPGGTSVITTCANTPSACEQGFVAESLNLDVGGFSSGLVSGLQWAYFANEGGKMLGGMAGMSDKNSETLGASMAAGFGVYRMATTCSTTSGVMSATSWGLVGAAIGVAIFVANYRKVTTETATFSCMPWQAPNAGIRCEECNDAALPCSEYKCRSLGQSCEIVNEGTEDEKCVYVNPRDTNPPVISPNLNRITDGYDYSNVVSSPPSPGFDIENLSSSDQCLKAFTPIEFGLIVDEPAQCKIDFNSTEKFDDMIAYVGGSNLYKYNHSEVFSLPGAKELMGSGFTLTNGKDMTFYVRCKDKKGNENGAEYAVNFCIDPTPDTTAPKIEATDVMNDGCVAQGMDNASVTFYVNEPAECRWSFQDQDYSSMGYEMSCSGNPQQISTMQLFPCEAKLTGIPRDGTSYYIRCNDTKGNAMRESYEFRLRGSTGLVLDNLAPNGTIFGGVSPSPVELYAETMFGCNDGLAICKWSTEEDGTLLDFFDTANEDGIHTQRVDLTAGHHEFFVKCIDGGGNVAEDVIEFDLDIDTDAPSIARVYEEDGMLKIVTVRDSECSYSLTDCDFAFVDGVEMPYGNTTNHVAEWDKDQTFYIKCRDEFLNEGSDCSLVVRPTENFL